MSFKDLNVDWSQIPGVLEQCVVGGSVAGPFEKGNDSTHEYVIRQGGKECKIHFFLKKNGTVTVHYKVGTNPGLSEQIAREFVERAVVDTRKAAGLAIRNVDKENFDLLREFLVDEVKAEVGEEKSENGYLYLSLRSPYKDSLVYKYYDNGTLQVQGKPLYLWGQTLMFLAEFLSFEDVVKHQTSMHVVTVCPAQVRDQLEGMMPKSYGYLSDTHKKILASAVTLNKIDVQLPDYSSFAFPALRGVEGYVKQLLGGKGIVVGREGFKDLFQQNATRSAYILKEEPRREVGCAKTCDAVQSSYSFYNAHRHSLFHMEQQTETTRVIESREEACELIVKAIGVIEDTYCSIVG